MAGIYNSISISTINTPVQVSPPSAGHWVMYIFNTAGGKLYISDKNTVGNNATSFMVPTNLYSPGLPVTDPVWISSDTVGSVSVCFMPARS